MLRAQSKSLPSLARSISPSVTTINSVASVRCVSHHCTSRLTQREAAALTEAIRMKWSQRARFFSISAHSSGLADRLVWSRKIRTAERLNHGFATRSSARCSAAASSVSLPWL